MPKNLVIVESPAKAKTISQYLGADYTVESSVGHIRDLPGSAKEVPEEFKKKKWGRLGVNVENDFEPIYVENPGRKEQIRNLKNLMKSAERLYLATDEDREGEAIAWHLLEVLKPPKNMEVYRMVFHEITKEAIQQAVDSPREIDRNLVNAQEARRILDRLYGYEVSPVLWRKIASRLSAGRVQSVVKKLLVDREKKRMKFVSASFAELTADFIFNDIKFSANLEELDSKKIVQGGDFDSEGRIKNSDRLHLDLNAAEHLTKGISDVKIVSKKSRPYMRRPQPPLTTSDLQQTAGNRYGMSSAMIMSAAQQLYEKGLITYMRTDANNLSEAALKSARTQIKEELDEDYLSPEIRKYKNKAKNVQEAHEAIRPTGDRFLTPSEIARKVPKALADVYAVIYERTLASQMTDEVGETTAYIISAKSASGQEMAFRAAGTVITHSGFRKILSKQQSKQDSNESETLPQMQESDALEFVSAQAMEKTTRPPARFTEASMVAKLEELGVGRPSTYASTIKTVLNRGYAYKGGSQIIPSFTAFAVVQLLEKHFQDLVDPNFTARLEDELDEISLGNIDQRKWLKDFYLGDANSSGLQTKVEEELDSIDARAVSTISLGKDSSGKDIDVRVGKYGPFVSREDDTASIPGDIPPDEMSLEKAIEILNTPSELELGKDPETGMSLIGLRGRFGPYVRVGTNEELKENGVDLKSAKTASLFSDMRLEEITFEQALQLLSLPRVVGEHEGKEILASNGPFGPYIKHGRETRSLESEEQLLTVSLEECLALLAKPKKFGRSRGSANLRELGKDSMTDNDMSIKSGRFGFYVTDGEVNASLMDTDDPHNITAERGSELLAGRREKIQLEGGAPKLSKPRRTTAKKPRSGAGARKAGTAK